MSRDTNSKAKITIQIRVAPELYDLITKAAQAEERSMTSFITILIRDALQPKAKPTTQTNPKQKPTIQYVHPDAPTSQPAAPEFDLKYKLNELLQYWEIQVHNYSTEDEPRYIVTGADDFMFEVTNEEEFFACVKAMEVHNIEGA